MSWRHGRVAALVVALLAFFSIAPPAQARIGSCPGCGTVTDVDEIYFARDRAPDGTSAGSIIGGTAAKQVGKAAPAPGVATGGLVGRKASGSDQGDDQRGLRLELKMDGGGQRTIEVVEGMRIYKGDRLRVHSNRIEQLD